MASGFRRRRRVTAKQRLAKIMERAEKILGEGDVYEASQSFKALVPRYVKDDKFSDAADLLREGCLKMLKHKEFRCALDLSTDLLGTFYILTSTRNARIQSKHMTHRIEQRRER